MIESSKMAALGVMASGLAHEINNPLMIITGRLQILGQQLQKLDLKNPEIFANLQRLTLTTERIAKIIRGLKTISRTGHNDPYEHQTLDSMIADAMQICNERFKESEIKIEVQLNPGIYCRCRAVQISQVFFNLLSNAYDAVQSSSEKWIRIHTKINTTGDRIQIFFIDSGPGIPKDVSIRIMEPFFTTKNVGKGTGLGLRTSEIIT